MNKKMKIALSIPFIVTFILTLIRNVPVEMILVGDTIIFTNIFYDLGIPSILSVFMLFYTYFLMMYALIHREIHSAWIKAKKNRQRPNKICNCGGEMKYLALTSIFSEHYTYKCKKCGVIETGKRCK